MPLTSMSCCWRKFVNTVCTTGTGSFNIRPSADRLLVPSTDRRRSTRSVTTPKGIPRPSRSLGTGGTNNDCSSPNSGIISFESIGGVPAKVYARGLAVWRHAFVGKLALLLSLVAALPLAAANREAAAMYEEGRKAERAGHIARAYLLYSQAAALEPT